MTERLYDDLASWWPLLSPPEHYQEEAALYLSLLRRGARGSVRSLLDLGSGGGSLSANFPEDLDLVLLDRSESMIAVSQQSNPGRVHVQGDMRTARLGRTFDAVMLHDAVMYLTSRDDLLAAVQTAVAHLRPGGALLVVPDVIRETWEEGVDLGSGSDGARCLQMLEWRFDPDPEDETFRVEFAFMLREGAEVSVVHDRHTMGLFDRATWVRTLQRAGLEVLEVDPMELLDLVGEVFLARRP